MLTSDTLSDILNAINFPVVFVNTEHIIKYMNSSAVEQQSKQEDLIGKSIFACHNENSGKKIRELFDKLKNGAKEILFSESDEKKSILQASMIKQANYQDISNDTNI